MRRGGEGFINVGRHSGREVGVAAGDEYGRATEHTGKCENLMKDAGGGVELWQHCSPGKVVPRPNCGDTRWRWQTRRNGSVAQALPHRGSALAHVNDEEQRVRDPGVTPVLRFFQLPPKYLH
jgi:hypothetical protein